jgi:hypothetical protein
MAAAGTESSVDKMVCYYAISLYVAPPQESLIHKNSYN